MTATRVEIHLLRPLEIAPSLADSWLTPDERARAARFRFRCDAVRWSAFRAGLRRILGAEIGCAPADVPLELGPAGKPLLAAPFAGLHFNLSHCSDLAVVAVSASGAVGIDLEPLTRAPELLECESIFCHPREIADLPADPAARATALLRIWTAKEAVLKAWGIGLSHPPETLRLRFGPEGLSLADSGGAWRISEIPHPALAGYRCALAAEEIDEVAVR